MDNALWFRAHGSYRMTFDITEEEKKLMDERMARTNIKQQLLLFTVIDGRLYLQKERQRNTLLHFDHGD